LVFAIFAIDYFDWRMQMEELLNLRTAIEAGRYNDALVIISEMEEMAKSDKTHKIRSYMAILLIHLVKQAAEKRTTRSWTLSIQNAVDEIRDVNVRRESGGWYLNEQELRTSLDEKLPAALKRAAIEAFEGACTARQLAASIDTEAIKAEALHYILNGYPEDEE
jgi:Domain of unknown function DUF29